jgi:hypothetical protein
LARVLIHPGEHLADELKALDMSANELARSSCKAQASDTRKPCRNIMSNKQQLRASKRLPLVTAMSFSKSRPVRCFRLFVILF